LNQVTELHGLVGAPDVQAIGLRHGDRMVQASADRHHAAIEALDGTRAQLCAVVSDAELMIQSTAPSVQLASRCTDDQTSERRCKVAARARASLALAYQ